MCKLLVHIQMQHLIGSMLMCVHVYCLWCSTHVVARAVCCSNFGSGYPLPMTIDYLYCTGNENTISECSHNGVGVSSCSIYEAAGIRCGGTCTVECFLPPHQKLLHELCDLYSQRLVCQTAKST